MKKIALYISCFLLSGSYLGAYGQCDDLRGGLVSSSDTTRCIGEHTNLLLSNYVGGITWEYSETGIEPYIVISGVTTPETTVFPTVDTYYRAKLKRDGCADSISTTLLIDVLNSGLTAVGQSNDACGKILSLNAETPTGFWSFKSGPDANVIFSNPLADPDQNVEVDTFGIYIFAWNVGAACAAVNVTNFEQNKAQANNNLEHCWLASKQFPLEASLSRAGATGTWSAVVPGTLTFTDASDPNTLVTPINVGTYQARWTETYGICTDDTIIDITMQRQPVALPSIPAPVCDSSLVLTATDTWGNTNIWSQQSGSGLLIFNDSTALSTLVTASDYGAYSVQLFCQNFFCEDDSVITISFIEQPLANAIPTPDNCGETAQLIANPSVGEGWWSFITGAGTVNIADSATSSTTVVIDNSYGSYTFAWNENNNGCADNDTISFTFFEQPVSNAGVSDSLCNLSTTLAANPSTGIGQWSQVDGPGQVNFTFPNSPGTTANASDFGVYTLQWKEINAICADSSRVELSFFMQPDANAGLGGDTCGLNFNLQAIPSIAGSEGYWFLQTGPGTANFNPADSTLSLATVSVPGDYLFQWTETNALCLDSALVKVTYIEKPIADAGEGGNACGLSYQLQATPSLDNAFWFVATGPDGAVFQPSERQADANLIVADTGIYQLTWRVDNGSCSTDSSITLHFYEIPVVEIMPGDSICGNNTLLTSTQSIGTGTWSQLSGTGQSSFTDFMAESTEVQVNSFGNFVFQRTVLNGACADSETVDISFLEAPTANAGTYNSNQICGFSFQLNALPSSGSGSWRQTAGADGAQFIPDNNAPDAEFIAAEAGNYTLLWTERNEICEDTALLTIELILNPVADAGPDQELDNEFETQLDASLLLPNELGTWTSLGENAVFSNTNLPNSEVSGLVLGQNFLAWNIDNGLCSDADTMMVMVYDIFIPDVITPNDDGENDFFVIRGVDDLSQVELSIFNRWGMEVFSDGNYKNTWNGVNKSGAELTNDTYFYVATIDKSRVLKGFVIIKR